MTKHKAIRRASLTWSELKEVLLDVKINLNICPLNCVEDDFQYLILTPNTMLLERETATLKEPSDGDDEIK